MFTLVLVYHLEWFKDLRRFSGPCMSSNIIIQNIYLYLYKNTKSVQPGETYHCLWTVSALEEWKGSVTIWWIEQTLVVLSLSGLFQSDLSYALPFMGKPNVLIKWLATRDKFWDRLSRASQLCSQTVLCGFTNSSLWE